MSNNSSSVVTLSRPPTPKVSLKITNRVLHLWNQLLLLAPTGLTRRTLFTGLDPVMINSGFIFLFYFYILFLVFFLDHAVETKLA